MKIKLTPELSYIIGLWRKTRSYEGLGVRSRNEIIELFSKEVLEKKLTTPDKLLNDENKVLFHHSAYKKFFLEIENEQLERFKYLNEYAASYLAGLFDAVGEITDDGFVSISRTNRQDELLFLRLGFGAKTRAGKLYVTRPKAFLAFIKNYVKLYKDHKIFSYIKQ